MRPVTRFQQSGSCIYIIAETVRTAEDSAISGVKPGKQPAARPPRRLFLGQSHGRCRAGGKTSAVAPKQVKTKEHVAPGRPAPGPASPQGGHHAPAARGPVPKEHRLGRGGTAAGSEGPAGGPADAGRKEAGRREAARRRSPGPCQAVSLLATCRRERSQGPACTHPASMQRPAWGSSVISLPPGQDRGPTALCPDCPHLRGSLGRDRGRSSVPSLPLRSDLCPDSFSQRSNSKHAMILADPLPQSADFKKARCLTAKHVPF